MEFAFGDMGMTPDEWELMTFLQYNLKCRGYMKRLERDWEHTRFIATSIINTVAKKPLSPEQVMSLPGDKKHRKSTANAKTDAAALIERIKQRDQANK